MALAQPRPLGKRQTRPEKTKPEDSPVSSRSLSLATHKRLRLVVAHLGRDRRLEVLPAVGAGRIPSLSVVVSGLVHRGYRN